MKIVGLYLVRNEEDIIGVNLRAHLSTWIDSALVVDNGSSDGTLSRVKQLAREFPIKWTSDAGPYRQQAILTDLAREAHDEGAAWVLAIDADEFWCGVGGDARRELASTDAGALFAELLTFVQRRDVLHNSPEALLTMTRRAAKMVPFDGAEAALDRREICFLEIESPRKCIVRPTADVTIAFGNHGASGMDGAEAPANILKCLHAPIRSYDALVGKAHMGPRYGPGGFAPGQGWHSQRWDRLLQRGKLGQEWAANSWDDRGLRLRAGLLRTVRRPVTVDTRLADVVRPWMA
jgi:hypothetical protein